VDRLGAVAVVDVVTVLAEGLRRSRDLWAAAAGVAANVAAATTRPPTIARWSVLVLMLTESPPGSVSRTPFPEAWTAAFIPME
jgi:hypothetical protein